MDFIDHGATGFAEVVAHRDELRADLRAAAAGPLPAGSALHSLADGKALADDEVIDHALLLLVAATETTSSALTNVFPRIGLEPLLLDAIRDDPSVAGLIVRETLRHEPPLHFTLRYVEKPTLLAGVELPQGAAIQACIASANRDRRVHDDPHRWDMDRGTEPTLTFGAGRHHCLGMGLGRIELETTLLALARRFEGLELVAPADPSAQGRMFRRVRGVVLHHSRMGVS